MGNGLYVFFFYNFWLYYFKKFRAIETRDNTAHKWIFTNNKFHDFNYWCLLAAGCSSDSSRSQKLIKNVFIWSKVNKSVYFKTLLWYNHQRLNHMNEQSSYSPNTPQTRLMSCKTFPQNQWTGWIALIISLVLLSLTHVLQPKLFVMLHLYISKCILQVIVIDRLSNMMFRAGRTVFRQSYNKDQWVFTTRTRSFEKSGLC